MFDNVRLYWRLWSLFEEVKDMDSKTLLKVLVAALLAGGSAAGTAYLSDNPVSLVAVANAVVVAVVAYLKASPFAK